MSAATHYPHLTTDDDGTPRIGTTRYKVIHLAAEHFHHGWTAEELLRQHPDLRLDEVDAHQLGPGIGESIGDLELVAACATEEEVRDRVICFPVRWLGLEELGGRQDANLPSPVPPGDLDRIRWPPSSQPPNYLILEWWCSLRPVEKLDLTTKTAPPGLLARRTSGVTIRLLRKSLTNQPSWQRGGNESSTGTGKL